jgi:hypothetical protein
VRFQFFVDLSLGRMLQNRSEVMSLTLTEHR